MADRSAIEWTEVEHAVIMPTNHSVLHGHRIRVHHRHFSAVNAGSTRRLRKLATTARRCRRGADQITNADQTEWNRVDTLCGRPRAPYRCSSDVEVVVVEMWRTHPSWVSSGSGCSG
jgi:hypothetical protein